MELVIEFFNQFTDPNWIMNNGGLYLILLILFIETGIIIGFFLPGDPLLFIAGVVIASASPSAHLFDAEWMNLAFWMVLFALATILGYSVGYWFGNKFESALKNRPDSWLFKKKYIQSAREFYNRKGGLAIGLSRFIPIVRTFAPVIGGMAGMNYKRFVAYNILGAIIWVGSITTMGYLLGEHPWVQRNLEYVILGIVFAATAPVIIKAIFRKKAVVVNRVTGKLEQHPQ